MNNITPYKSPFPSYVEGKGKTWVMAHIARSGCDYFLCIVDGGSLSFVSDRTSLDPQPPLPEAWEDEQAVRIEAQAQKIATLEATIEGMKAANGLRRCTALKERIEKHRLMVEVANARKELDEIKLWFAQAHTQGHDVPESVTLRALDEWKKTI
jgi:hypothetical protein